MRVSTAINEDELPHSFRQTFKIAPKEAWQRRAGHLDARGHQNPFLKEYFDEKYSIERSLARALHYQQVFGQFAPVRGAQAAQYYKLYSFVHILSSVYDRLSPKRHSRLPAHLTVGLTTTSRL